MKANDGGAAFPRDYESGVPGMSLREWFAGQALAGILANPEYLQSATRCNVSTEEYTKDTITAALRFADAMLAHRAKEVSQ